MNRDITLCTSKCANQDCPRKYRDELAEHVARLSFAALAPVCPEYKRPQA